MLIAILSTIGGANGWEDIEVYAESHQDWLATILDLRHGILHADAYRRVFERIDHESFQPCLLNWLGQIVEATGAQVVLIDGKTVRGSYDRNQQQSALHLVSAWASEHRQFEIALSHQFEGIVYSHDCCTEAGHYRREQRQVWAVPATAIRDLYQPTPWVGLQMLVMVVRVRHLWNKTTCEVQCYLTSLACDAVQIGRAIRTHWGIENQLHWVLDVTFGEDACRIRTGHSPENFALMRPMAMSWLNQEPSTKRSLRQKMKRAAMNPNYLLQVLSKALSR